MLRITWVPIKTDRAGVLVLLGVALAILGPLAYVLLEG